MQFSKIIICLAFFMASMVSAAAVPSEDLSARCTKCKNDNDCANGSPFSPVCKKGCCDDN